MPMLRITLAHNVRAYDTYVVDVPEDLLPEGWKEHLDDPDTEPDEKLVDFLRDNWASYSDSEGVENPETTVTIHDGLFRPTR